MSAVYLKLTKDDGTVQEFRKNRVTARYIKEGFKLNKKLEELEKKGNHEGLLDARVQFTADFFDDKSLTADAIWDGLESNELIPTLDKVFNSIMGIGSGDESGES